MEIIETARAPSLFSDRYDRGYPAVEGTPGFGFLG
jgi:hypothetical protein